MLQSHVIKEVFFKAVLNQALLEKPDRRIHIAVYADDELISANPVLEPQVMGGIVKLSIGNVATRNLRIEDDYLIYDTRFSGVEYTLRIHMKNVVAIHDPDTTEDPICLLTIQYVLNTGEIAAATVVYPQAVTPQVDEVSVKPNRPSLKVVK